MPIMVTNDESLTRYLTQVTKQMQGEMAFTAADRSQAVEGVPLCETKPWQTT